MIVSRLLLKEKTSLEKTQVNFSLKCYPEYQMYVTRTIKVGRKEVKGMKETRYTDASMLLSLELQDEFICEPVKFAARSGCGMCGCSTLGVNDGPPGK